MAGYLRRRYAASSVAGRPCDHLVTGVDSTKAADCRGMAVSREQSTMSVQRYQVGTKWLPDRMIAKSPATVYLSHKPVIGARQVQCIAQMQSMLPFPFSTDLKLVG